MCELSRIKDLAILNDFDGVFVLYVEETAELAKAYTKFLRYGASPERLTDLYEEIADVEIVLEELKELFSCRTEVNEWKCFKLKRGVKHECKV